MKLALFRLDCVPRQSVTVSTTRGMRENGRFAAGCGKSPGSPTEGTFGVGVRMASPVRRTTTPKASGGVNAARPGLSRPAKCWGPSGPRRKGRIQDLVLDANRRRFKTGTFLSSLDMAGISISVLGIDDDRLRWLDAPTTAPAWPNVPKQRPGKLETEVMVRANLGPNAATAREVQTVAGREMRRAIEAACQAIIEAESELTELDRITGDGDLGAA
jgi:hypothetical protein